MADKEAFDAQQEAKKGVAGEVAPSTRERIAGGLARYLNAEALHATQGAGREGKQGATERG